MSRIIAFGLIISIVKYLMQIMKSEITRAEIESDKAKADSYLVKLPRLNMIIGGIGIIGFGAMLAMVVLSPEPVDWIAYPLLSVMTLGCVGLVISYFNWQIVVFHDYFVYRTFFRNTYLFRYEDIVKSKVGQEIIRIKVKDRWLFMDPYSVNMERFTRKIERISKKART